MSDAKREEAIRENVRQFEQNHGFCCPSVLAICTDTKCGTRIITQISPRFPEWCVRVKCGSCTKVWNVCRICSARGMQHSRLTTNRCLERHETTEHPEQPPNAFADDNNGSMAHDAESNKLGETTNLTHDNTTQNENDTIDALLNDDTDDGIDLFGDEDFDSYPRESKQQKTSHHSNFGSAFCENDDRDKKQLNYMPHHLEGNGSKYLTALQFTDTKNPLGISPLDAELSTTLAMFIQRISRGEREILSRVMNLTVKKVIRDNSSDPQHVAERQKYTMIAVPTTSNEFRRFVEGKWAILGNVPIPKITQLSNGDCYILPSDFCVSISLLGL